MNMGTLSSRQQILASALQLGPPTKATLFPYTTLFRSRRKRRCGAGSCRWRALLPKDRRRAGTEWARRFISRARPFRSGARSEEHTSELQSLAYLVCRLLLEKKKSDIDRYEHLGVAHSV